MLSYQHGYHAGNFADVHKHAILAWLLTEIKKKKKSPLTYIETHAGRGVYDLTSNHARKTGEARYGINALWPTAKRWPRELQPYKMSLVKALSKRIFEEKFLSAYIGSPIIALKALTPKDNLICHELHPQENKALNNAVRAFKNVKILKKDGLSALETSKHTPDFIHIDPSYEIKSEYENVAKKAVNFAKKNPNTCIMIWYPLLPERLDKSLYQICTQIEKERFYSNWVRVRKPDHGMFGSGLIILNPPVNMKTADQISSFIERIIKRKFNEKPIKTRKTFN